MDVAISECCKKQDDTARLVFPEHDAIRVRILLLFPSAFVARWRIASPVLPQLLHFAQQKAEFDV